MESPTPELRSRIHKKTNDSDEDNISLPVYTNERTFYGKNKKNEKKEKRDYLWIKIYMLRVINTIISFIKNLKLNEFSIKQFVMDKKAKVIDYFQALNSIDREASMGAQETYLQVKMKEFWYYYKTNIRFSILMTILCLVFIYYTGNYLLSREIVIRDNDNNVIDNPFIYKIDGRPFMPTNEVHKFKREDKWFKSNENREIQDIDFKRGYFPAEVYSKGVMNVPFNQTLLLLEDRCISDSNCNCAALSQFGINKNIYVIKTEDSTQPIIMYNLNIVQKAERTIKTSVTINGRRNIESPSSFIIEYNNQNGKKVRYTTANVLQAVCVQLFYNIQDLSFYN
jgi:hypothetical protein